VKDSEENAEEEVKEMTYDEWKKIEDEKRAKPIFNLRKPGEGEDVAQWKKTYVLKKKVEEEGDEEEYEEIEVIRFTFQVTFYPTN
jgi:plasminogen activator inhibitor 1 RNA-binding protein